MRRLRAPLALLGLALTLGTASAGAQTIDNPLSIMVVPRGQLGSAVDGLQVELVSGEVSNARAAGNSYDPNDSAASVTRAGRMTGYTLLYGDVGLGALRSGKGLIELGTSVDLFKSEAKASAYELKTIRDLHAVIGRNLGGVVIEGAAPFQVNGLGPSGVGLRIVQRIGTKRLYGTYIDFQVDRILCQAIVTRADSANADAQALKIAQSLFTRIVEYAQGQLQASPVPLPRPLGMSKPQPKTPDLEKMALTSDDLKGKAGVFEQGYGPEDTAILAYSRELRFAPKTKLLFLQNRLSLQRSRREAAGRMVVLRGVFTGPEAAETIAAFFGGSTGPQTTKPTFDGKKALGIGQESFASSVTFDTATGPTRVVVAYFRRNRVVSMVALVGSPKALSLDSVTSHVRAADKRIQAVLGKSPLVA